VLIDMSAAAELRFVEADAERLDVGASVRSPSLRLHPPSIIAGPTHRNMGTVGCYLCLDTRCIFYNQSEWWRAANHHCLKTTGEICHVAPKSRSVCFATFAAISRRRCSCSAPRSISPVPPPDGGRSRLRLYIGFARQDEAFSETRGDGNRPLPPRCRRRAGATAAAAALRFLTAPSNFAHSVFSCLTFAL
jgi:hypothetical protein